jgi:arylsulfatase A-like enzyme
MEIIAPSYPSIILISLDEVRPDHLSCYGYARTCTPGLNQIAELGVTFEQMFSSSDFTPVAIGTALTGLYPDKHAVRDPYCRLQANSIATFLKACGYVTAGFSGNGILTRRHYFARGFDVWDEPTADTRWALTDYQTDDPEVFFEGNNWTEKCLSWISRNAFRPFFVWGHYYETHGFSEDFLLRTSRITKDHLKEWSYYDAKIEMADRELVQPVLRLVDKLGIAGRTIIAIISDHGTNLGEKPCAPLPWRPSEVYYPQHTTLYDFDLRVMALIAGPMLPAGRRVKGLTGLVDLAPTLLDLSGVPPIEARFDGQSLRNLIHGGLSNRTEVYAEDLFASRGPGALQAVRTDCEKYIRNLSSGEEEYYRLDEDPCEETNQINEIPPDRAARFRAFLDARKVPLAETRDAFTDADRTVIRNRLHGMGYRLEAANMSTGDRHAGPKHRSD